MMTHAGSITQVTGIAAAMTDGGAATRIALPAHDASAGTGSKAHSPMSSVGRTLRELITALLQGSEAYFTPIPLRKDLLEADSLLSTPVVDLFPSV